MNCSKPSGQILAAHGGSPTARAIEYSTEYDRA
jgi:hypothetical protein